jgi:hypothetical protein
MALAELIGCQVRPHGVRDGVLLGGVRLEACEIVEEVVSSGCVGNHRHEPVVLSLKPLVMLGHLGAVGSKERVLVTGTLRTPPADRVYDGELKRQAHQPVNRSNTGFEPRLGGSGIAAPMSA